MLPVKTQRPEFKSPKYMTKKKKSVMSLNFSLGREEHRDRRIPQVHFAISWTFKLQIQWGSPISKKRKWRANEERYAVLNLDFTFTHTCAHTYTYLQTYLHDYTHRDYFTYLFKAYSFEYY